MDKIVYALASELKISEKQVQATIDLLDEGNTVPFIARYRKEDTNGLSDTELRDLVEKLEYLRELEQRKVTILNSIKEQGKLTSELEAQITHCMQKARLEDLYKPFKPKRKTLGSMAIEAGFDKVLERILKELPANLNEFASEYTSLNENYKTIEDVLNATKYILAEQIACMPELITELREILQHQGYIVSKVKSDKDIVISNDTTDISAPKKSDKDMHKFADYFDYKESVLKIPAHRVMAVLRGRNENILRVSINSDFEFIPFIIQKLKYINNPHELQLWFNSVVQMAWQVKIKPQLEVELFTMLKTNAEQVAVKVFAQNLDAILMAAPAGARSVLGLDPGYRTGVKVTAVDATGKVLYVGAIFPHVPQRKWDEALAELYNLCKTHNIEIISIGNGTASRETEKLVLELIKKYPELNLTKVIVSEAGASVYSASQFAADEFPDIDVSYRGAISIARRLQDPLAELVKISPEALGVGLYQHDIQKSYLQRKLSETVQDCVNRVGVDINTASSPLLSQIAGLNSQIADNIINHRNQYGKFTNREQIKKVSRLGPKAYEQSAGFLRINSGENLLDSSAVHPESYYLVHNIANNLGYAIEDLLRNEQLLSTINPAKFVSDSIGLPTVMDIIDELKKPGRDPRPDFKTAVFSQDITEIKDLVNDTILEGVVTNVTSFGAFVDIGVKQDGLVHISNISNKYISNPSDLLKTGDIIKVRVIGVEVERKRINLSMILTTESQAKSSNKLDTTKKTSVNVSSNINQNKNSKNTNKSQQSSNNKTNSLLGQMLKNALEQVK